MSGSYNKVAVFCGSRLGNKPIYAEEARALGRELGRRPVEIIYGGGDMGLMGEFSRAAHAEGASITAVIPHTLIKPARYINPKFSLITVEDLFQRKSEMLFGSQLAFALPGGVGTFDENFEMIAFNDLEKYKAPGEPIKPLILVNIDGHFNGMAQLLDKAIETGFSDPEIKCAIHWAGSTGEAMEIYDDLRRKPMGAVCTLMPTPAKPAAPAA